MENDSNNKKNQKKIIVMVGCQFYTVHKITGYFHKCYFTLI
jgi:hypothetical protein